MERCTKRFILFSSFAAFFILGCLMVFYAFGYQFDFKNFKLVETGGLLIKANLDGIDIFINGRLQGKTSFFSGTFVKKNLLPGNYALKIEKDGFSILNKKVEIRSGEVSQLAHLFMAEVSEISNYMQNFKPSEENNEYVIDKTDGLLYKTAENKKPEKISSEPVYINDFVLRLIGNDIYIASEDADAPGAFLLDKDGTWKQIHDSPANSLSLSLDGKKLAIVGPYEITVLWLKDDGEPPYLKKGHKESVLKISEKIEDAFWFKTDWHLIYLTTNGEAHFIELDPTGGRNNLII